MLAKTDYIIGLQYFFLPFFKKRTSFVTSCLISCLESELFYKENLMKEKYFSIIVDPQNKGHKNDNGRYASPESVSIHPI